MRRNQKGFTLLEVLVATVIMAIAVSGLLANLSGSLRVAAKLTNYDRAAQLARLKMDELLINQTAPRFQMMQGPFDQQSTGWPSSGWRAQIVPYEKPPGPAAPGSPVLDKVDLEIWWMDGTNHRSFRLEGFRRGILKPEEAAMVGTQ